VDAQKVDHMVNDYRFGAQSPAGGAGDNLCAKRRTANRRHNSSEESKSSRLEGLYREASDSVLRVHLQIDWRISPGDSVGEMARMVSDSV
jgi:hypothetical protein